MAATRTQAQAIREQERYLPIADYGVIGDGRSIALVSRTGSIDWWCLPRPDSDPIFARLLDADQGGFFSIQPRAPFQSQHAYVNDTNILTTDFTTDTGTVRVHDYMPALTEEQKRRYPVPFRSINRTIEGVAGLVPIRICLRPVVVFGSRTPRVWEQRADRFVVEWGHQALHILSSVPLRVEPDMLVADLEVVAGQQVHLIVSYSTEAPAELPTLRGIGLIRDLTEQFWHNWVSACTYHGPYRDAVVRSALALKLMMYAPSGAILAAPTTSLPEKIGGVRNWDYRYCWLRDASFTIRALLSIGYFREAEAFAAWLLYATRLTHPRLQVLYTIYGESYIPERTIDYLDGYQGSRPVRFGNAASEQFQLDVYGEVIDALRIYHRVGGVFDSDARRLIAGMAGVIARRWTEPDDGIWEVRSGRAQHIHSKVMAWVGLDAVAELANDVDLNIPRDRFEPVRRAVHDWVLTHGFDPQIGAFTRTPGHDLDAALLVIPLVDFLGGHDPRVVGTVDAIQRHLGRGELIYRYLGEDGLPGSEGAFVICSFWMVEALAHIGRLDEAHQHFQALLGRCNALGLLAEEIDPDSGAQLGNFPQAFSHIGLINAALTLEEIEQGKK